MSATTALGTPTATVRRAAGLSIATGLLFVTTAWIVLEAVSRLQRHERPSQHSQPEGETRDLTDIPLDFDDSVPEFHRQVYDVARTIKPGTTLSYGEVAARLGRPTRRQCRPIDIIFGLLAPSA